MAGVPPGWSFPRAFWVANLIELFERAAWYGMFIALALFLTSVVGFSDVQAGWIGAGLSSLVFLLPMVTGAIADRIGFRPALALAFVLLAAGYATLGLLPRPAPVLIALFVLVPIGGAFVKPIITGTVARSSTGESRARAYSLFYMVVNIGSFSGKSVAKPVRQQLGLAAVPLYAAVAAAVALVLVLLLYRIDARREHGADRAPAATPAPSLPGLLAVIRNGRFLALILIVAGFWVIQGQLYASMPKYVLRMVGDGASPEWYANVNPLVVVLCVVPVTWWMRRLAPITSIGVALGLIPLAALLMALSPWLPRDGLVIAGRAWPSITVMMVAGIALMGFAECFLSPRYLEYASKLAPPGQEGLYLGYSHLTTFIAWLVGFAASGYLLEAFCPDPAKLAPAARVQRLAALAGDGAMPAEYAHAHYLWFCFVGVGAVAFLALLAFHRLASGPRPRPL